MLLRPFRVFKHFEIKNNSYNTNSVFKNIIQNNATSKLPVSNRMSNSKRLSPFNQSYFNTLIQTDNHHGFFKQLINSGTSVKFSTNKEVHHRNIPFIELGNALRALNCGPHDHIPMLIQPVELQFQFIKKQTFTEKENKIYQKFVAEFEDRKLKQCISYVWWVTFSHRLAILITSEKDKLKNLATYGGTLSGDFYNSNEGESLSRWHTFDGYMNFLNKVAEDKFFAVGGSTPRGRLVQYHNLLGSFPNIILVPTLDFDISIQNFNAGFLNWILPLGLTTGKGFAADGEHLSPDEFFIHDVIHVIDMDNKFKSKPTIHLFVEFTLNAINDIKDIKIKSQLNFMLFLMTHEFINLFFWVDPKDLKKLIKSNNTFYDYSLKDNYYGHLIHPYLAGTKSQEEEIIEYVDESVDLMTQHISNFFEHYQIKHFYDKVKLEGNEGKFKAIF